MAQVSVDVESGLPLRDENPESPLAAQQTNPNGEKRGYREGLNWDHIIDEGPWKPYHVLH